MKKLIPVTDLTLQNKALKAKIAKEILNLSKNCDFVLGQEVGLFEEDIAKYCGVKYAVGVASGTDALVLSLLALGIGTGDEVITTPFTFIATAEAIVRAGAKPVFCDIKPDTYNIDEDKIEALINSKTKAILPVHLYGLSCNMDKILSIAKKYNLKVAEDCAQSLGSRYNNNMTGSFGKISALSFFPSKNLGCFGDGGAVLTNDEELAKKVRLMRNHGSSDKYKYIMHGFNSRLDTIQAAILRIKLENLDKWVKMRRKNAELYIKLLNGVQGVTLPMESEGYYSSYNYFTIRIKNNRTLLKDALKNEGVSSAIYYPLSLHLQDVFKNLGYSKGNLPNAEAAQEEVLSLPMYPELKTAQIKKIASVIRKALK
ncbi:MAG: DegT/DnrJ/EryC1/StrS family aminotransferase [Patescibacteria group bacterium]